METYNDFLLCFCLNIGIKSFEDNAGYNLNDLWKIYIFDVLLNVGFLDYFRDF